MTVIRTTPLSNYSFSDIMVKTYEIFELPRKLNEETITINSIDSNNKYKISHHIHLTKEFKIDTDKDSTIYNDGFYYHENRTPKNMIYYLSIPNGYGQLLLAKGIKYESHIPYPPDFYINILDTLRSGDDVTKMINFLKLYVFKTVTSQLNNLNFDNITIANAKTNPDIIHVKKEFRKLQRRWERNIVDSLRAGYTKYKRLRYSSLKKSKSEVDEEGKEISSMIRTREFQNFGQTLLSPDEIWADFVKLMTHENLYNNFEMNNISIKYGRETFDLLKTYTERNEFNDDENNNYFQKIFIGDDNENLIHFYSDDYFLGHRFKLLNVRYLWKYGRRASENNSAGIGNSWLSQFNEWQRMMGYYSGYTDGDIRMNEVGNIMFEFLKHNKDLIRDDDCIQQELISNYQMAVANSYWNKYNEDDNEFRKKGIHHSPIFWMIIIIVVHRAFNVFFSLIKKDDTETSGFVYKLEGIPFSGLKDLFKYGDEGQITIHSAYSVLSPYWSFLRNEEREIFKNWFIKGYKENKTWESDPKDGPYVPHSNKDGIYISGQPDQSIYLPNETDRTKNLTLLKLLNYTSCVTIGFWFSFLENTIFERLIRKKTFEGNKIIVKKFLYLLLACILAPLLSLGIAAALCALIVMNGVSVIVWVFICLFTLWSIANISIIFKDSTKNTNGMKKFFTIFLIIFCIGLGITIYMIGIHAIPDGSGKTFSLKFFYKFVRIFFYCTSLVPVFFILFILKKFSKYKSRKFKWIETFLTSPIWEDYSKKEIDKNGTKKGLFWSIVGGVTMVFGLFLALIKMVPLTLYLFLWGSAPMKGGPGSDSVSQVIDWVGIFTMLIIFVLLVIITVTVYDKNVEGKIKVRENAIISAMPHMAYKIPRFKYEALFLGYKSKLSIQEQKNEIVKKKREYKKEKKWDQLVDSYNKKDLFIMDENEKLYYQVKAEIEKLDENIIKLEKNELSCFDEDRYKNELPPLGILGITIFVFAAQIAITQIYSNLIYPNIPKKLLKGLKLTKGLNNEKDEPEKDDPLETIMDKAKMASKVKARIILIILIIICVIIIWVIEYLPQLLIVMENMDSREEKALKMIRKWNNDNKDKPIYEECPENLINYKSCIDKKLVSDIENELNKNKLVVPGIRWDVFGVIIAVVVILLGILSIYLFFN